MRVMDIVVWMEEDVIIYSMISHGNERDLVRRVILRHADGMKDCGLNYIFESFESERCIGSGSLAYWRSVHLRVHECAKGCTRARKRMHSSARKDAPSEHTDAWLREHPPECQSVGGYGVCHGCSALSHHRNLYLDRTFQGTESTLFPLQPCASFWHHSLNDDCYGRGRFERR